MTAGVASASPAELALTVVRAVMDRLSDEDRREVARTLVNRYAPEAALKSAPAFAPRHWAVLRLLADGATTTKMAMEVGVTRYTLMNYIGEMNKLMGTASRTALVAEAFRRGML